MFTQKNIKTKINEFKPDIIVVTWIEFLISLKTLYEIKVESDSNVIFVSMDNHLLTGGCRYVNECENYLSGCKNCIALKASFKI